MHALSNETEQQQAELLCQRVTFERKLSMVTEKQQIELLRQRVTFKQQMTTEKQHMQCELSTTWASTDELTNHFQR